LNYPNPCGAMAGSSDDHQYLLFVNQNPSVSLILFEGNQYISTTAINTIVTDICWSKSTQVFLVATPYYLYEFNPFNSILSQPYGNSQSIRNLWTITCDLTDLFVIHVPDMSMYRRNNEKPFDKKHEWCKNEILCEQGDQLVGSIRIDEEKQICISIYTSFY
jgi:hypothetical protein